MGKLNKTLISFIGFLLVVGCQSSQNQPTSSPEEKNEVNVSVEFSKVPEDSLLVNQSYEFVWNVRSSEEVTTNLQASYSKEFFNAKETAAKGGSDIFSDNLSFDETGTVYIQANADVNGQRYTSNTIVKKVIDESSENSSERDEKEVESPEREVQEINLVAKKYRFEPSTVNVTEGVPVVIHARSMDVDHGLGISAFGVNEVLPVGENVTVRFTPDKTGRFKIKCTVYCGTGHSSMTGTLVVE